ncbi:MAG: hypothetical protein ACXAEU_07820 [Candidatus Hodarchaeales archaeon]
MSEQQRKEKVKEKTGESTITAIPRDFDDLVAMKKRLEEEDLEKMEMLKLKARIAKLEKKIKDQEKTIEKTGEIKGVKMVDGVEVMSPEVRGIIPPWTKKPWMWTPPSDENMRIQWIDRWGNFMMKFTRAKGIYLIVVKNFLDFYPFNNPVRKKSLTEDHLIDIGDYLVDKEHAVWWGKTKKRLRIYWQALEETADIVYDWGLMGGYDVVTLFDLSEANQKWSNLPPPDLVKIIDILVEDDRAQWLDDNKKSFTFIY